MSEQWLSIVEYARRYNLSDMTVRRHIKTGRIQAVLKEGKYFIPSGDNHHDESLELSPQSKPSATYRGGNNNNYEHLQNMAPQHEGSRVEYRPRFEGGFSSRPQIFTAPNHQHPKDTPKIQPRNILMREPHRDERRSGIEEASSSEISALEKAILKLEQAEGNLKEQFEAKFLAQGERSKKLEQEITHKEFQIQNLQQEVDDLQLLVKIMERRIQ